MFFGGCFRAGAQRAARQAVGPAVSPASAFHGRSAINPCGPTGGRQAVHQYQTEGDAYEATRPGRGRPAEEPGQGALQTRFRSSGYRASIRRPKPPGRPNNGTPEHPQTL